jgi:hypothetical protein
MAKKKFFFFLWLSMVLHGFFSDIENRVHGG